MKKLTAIVVGAGNRAKVYSSHALDFPNELEIVGVVDPNPARVELFKERYSICEENCYLSLDEFLKRDKFADFVINGTMDHLHVKTSIPVLEKGYDLLLEKPFAVNEEEMNLLCDTADKYGNKVVICHVLRYTDFYRAIKDSILKGDIGDIVSIEMNEHVNYIHMCVSYVRGKWRSEEVCFAPMLLAKSCHDVDIMMWMMNHTRPERVVSFGSDFQYGPDRKPENAGNKCMVDCPIKDNCIYDCEKNYITPRRWRFYVSQPLGEDADCPAEKIVESFKNDNHFGECAWNFDRGGNVDHQTLIVNFENGATGTFTMTGGTARSERNIHIIGTMGEIKGIFEDQKFVIRTKKPKMTKEDGTDGYTEKLIDLKITGDMIGQKGGHGGGDQKMMVDLMHYLNGEEPSVSCTTLKDSTISHHTVFMAEKSRKTGKIIEL